MIKRFHVSLREDRRKVGGYRKFSCFLLFVSFTVPLLVLVVQRIFLKSL